MTPTANHTNLICTDTISAMCKKAEIVEEWRLQGSSAVREKASAGHTGARLAGAEAAGELGRVWEGK